MKIRDGFVTNSSSTSYIIISKKKMSGEYLAKKMGITEDSLNYFNIVNVFKRMIKYGKDGFYGETYEESLNYKVIYELFGKDTADIFQKNVKKGYEIYCGSISSDNGDDYETAMCLDYLKSSDSDFYLDATVNWW